jgi:hypothetical protein
MTDSDSERERGRPLDPQDVERLSISVRVRANKELLLRGLPAGYGLLTGSSVNSARRGSLPHRWTCGYVVREVSGLCTDGPRQQNSRVRRRPTSVAETCSKNPLDQLSHMVHGQPRSRPSTRLPLNRSVRVQSIRS